MNEIVGNSPIRGRSEILDKKFEIWWRFLNGLGIFAFLIAVGIHGGPYQYGKAVLSIVILTWMYVVGRKHCWVHELSEIRRRDKLLGKEISADYLSNKIFFTAYLPFAIGYAYIALIAFWPILAKDMSLYVAI